MTTCIICAGDTSANDTLRIGVVGDSISAGTPHWDPDPKVRAAIAEQDERGAWPYWAARADRKLCFVVSAVDGQRTDEIVRRLDLVGGGLDAIVVQGGINDLAQGRTPKQAAEGIRHLVEQALDFGVPVGIPEILPWNSGYPTHQFSIQELNALVHEIAGEFHVTVFPFYRVLEDAERPGRMRPEWTVDGSHPSVEGHRRLGELAFSVPTRSRDY